MSLLLATGGSEAAPYEIGNSALLDGSTGYLQRTPGVAGNLTRWAFVAWMKRTSLSSFDVLFDTLASGAAVSALYNFSDRFGYTNFSGGSNGNAETDAVFRDPTAWMQVAYIWDSNNAVATDRMRVWVNGVRQNMGQPSGAVGTGPSMPTLGQTSRLNLAILHQISGRAVDNNGPLDAYLAETYFVDGGGDYTDFGQFDSNGVWVPKAYTGAYGTNGFHLKFDPSALNGLGHDHSGNGNHWTVVGGVTAASDSPSTNDAVYNAVSKSSFENLSSGNRGKTNASAGNTTSSTPLTIPLPATGRVYWEVSFASVFNPAAGIIPVENATGLMSRAGTLVADFVGGQVDEVAWTWASGTKYQNGAVTFTAVTFTAPDRMGFGFDADANTLTLYKNGVATGQVAAVTAGRRYLAAVTDANVPPQTSSTIYANEADLSVLPAGFQALGAAGLPTPTVTDPTTLFRVVTWTGTGGAVNVPVQDSQGNSWQPDLVVIKRTDAASDWWWYDTTRGATFALRSNSFVAQTTEATGLTAFTASGFSVGALHSVNTATYVAYCWKKQAGVFDIATHTGTGANQNVPHALGVTPAMVVSKSWDTGSLPLSTFWHVYHVGMTSASYYMQLESTGSETLNPTTWNSTAPTAAVYSIGTKTGLSTVGMQCVTYLWAEVPGMQSFGSYTGNGSADGVMNNLGFKPAMYTTKSTGFADFWYTWDNLRDPFNPCFRINYISRDFAQDTSGSGTQIDFLATGVKHRGNGSSHNQAGSSYVYLAWAEQPTGPTPATAR